MQSASSDCGCYYLVPQQPFARRVYLPQVKLAAHTTILLTTSRTTLQQTFVNPSTETSLDEVKYTFPLYSGVSVVGFTCKIGNRSIIGVVKEKEKARQVYDEAIANGETAGLMEQLPEASDVFTTTIGNIPANEKVEVEIVYLGELKHDVGADGIRFTIPSSIAPRYGQIPGGIDIVSKTPAVLDNEGLSITVDVCMNDEIFIRGIESPSHPIAVSMGTLSTSSPASKPSMAKASATLSLGSASLGPDFILIVSVKETGNPIALLEKHPTIPDHRALMVSMVPKFKLPPSHPEIVFVADRSGSMTPNVSMLRSSLLVFLKSLPVGVKFNICSFGSTHSFLWSRSQSYSKSSLDQAIAHINTFSADMGGTELAQPLEDTIQRRYKDLPLEIMVLTDGEIWGEAQLFSNIDKAVEDSQSPIRVFTLGIGHVSHSLIEGLARSGNGFSQAVTEGERLDTKLVRMLKGALTPHINNLNLEVHYKPSEDASEDEFELVDRVINSLQISVEQPDQTKNHDKPTISLFDDTVDMDKKETPPQDDQGLGRYSHLPTATAPSLLQAPHKLPNLYPSERCNLFVLLSSSSIRKNPESVTIRGESAAGPLEVKIPVQILPDSAETIHQLAAKKAVMELEQGRGWIIDAKDEDGKLLKDRYEGQFEDMIEREAVRLGLLFQVGGKWCSFVAVESNTNAFYPQEEAVDTNTAIPSHYLASAPTGGVGAFRSNLSPNYYDTAKYDPSIEVINPKTDIGIGIGSFCPGQSTTQYGSSSPPVKQKKQTKSMKPWRGITSFAARRRAGPVPSAPLHSAPFMGSALPPAPPADVAPLRGAQFPLLESAPSLTHLAFSNQQIQRQHSGFSPPPFRDEETQLPDVYTKETSLSDQIDGDDMDFESLPALGKLPAVHKEKRGKKARSHTLTQEERLAQTYNLINMQSFEGFWELTPQILTMICPGNKGAGAVHGDLKWPQTSMAPDDHREVKNRIWATLLVISYMQTMLNEEADSLALVVEKAQAWLESFLGDHDHVKGWLKKAAGQLQVE